VLQAAWQAATDSYDQTAAKGKKFKPAHEACTAFRSQQYLRRLSEYPDENFIIRQRAKG
jgi:TRAP-type mannitol/chloroaromatic compound transport system substrate-binding protein